jgi:carbon monoxide dehydrogenase subunit G
VLILDAAALVRSAAGFRRSANGHKLIEEGGQQSAINWQAKADSSEKLR